MNLLFAAQSGWGKSYHAQAWIEKNLPEYETTVLLDFKDEYRGLVKEDMAKTWIAGPHELADWGIEEWSRILEDNDRLVIAKHSDLDVEDWQLVAARVIAAARRLEGSVLVAIDEAHFVAPQRGTLHDSIKGLATTGRGEGASSMWITQRLTEIEETILAQCQARMLGGFESTGDLNKIARIIEYPEEVHNPQAGDVSHVPEELQAPEDGMGGLSTPLRKFEDDDGNTTGSEWIYSDNSGDRDRLDTSNLEMESTHYGAQGETLEAPNY